MKIGYENEIHFLVFVLDQLMHPEFSSEMSFSNFLDLNKILTESSKRKKMNFPSNLHCFDQNFILSSYMFILYQNFSYLHKCLFYIKTFLTFINVHAEIRAIAIDFEQTNDSLKDIRHDNIFEFHLNIALHTNRKTKYKTN